MFWFSVMRRFYQVRRAVAELFCGRNPRYSYSQVCHGNPPAVWEADIPPGSIMLEKVSRSIIDETDTRIRVWYGDQHFIPTSNFDLLFSKTPELPWLWIGGKNVDGETITATTLLAPYVVVGNEIRSNLLIELCPAIRHWQYMDIVTLEEIDFPVGGITIEEYVA